MNKRMSKRTVFFVIMWALILGSVLLAAWDIRYPGLYYDELIFTNASFLGPTDFFIRHRAFGVPVFIMDYIGALKSWLYFPIFSLLPVDEITVRLPAILIGVAGGALLVGALGNMYGRSAAIIGAVLILFDPSLLMHSRLDWGPTALMFFFRGVLVYSLTNWIVGGTPKWAWLAFFAILFGIFDKLNFLWLAGSSVCALAVSYPKRLRGFAVNHPRHACLLFLMGVLVFSSALWYAMSLSSTIGDAYEWNPRVHQMLRLMKLMLVGGGPLDFVAGDGMRLRHWVLPAHLLCIFAAIPGLWALIRHPQRRYWLFICAWSIGTFLVFASTPGATGYHHAAVLAGFPQALLAIPLALSFNARKTGHDMWHKIVAGTAIASCACLIIANLVCIRAFHMPTNPNWDRANTDVAHFAREHPGHRYITTDWGMGSQLLALSKSRLNVGDNWPSFRDEQMALHFIRRTASQYKEFDVLARTEKFENFKGNRRNLYSALDALSLSATLIAEFPNTHGDVMIQVLRVASSSQTTEVPTDE